LSPPPGQARWPRSEGMPQRFAAVLQGAALWSAEPSSPPAQRLATHRHRHSPAFAVLSGYKLARVATVAQRRLSRLRWFAQPALPPRTNCRGVSFCCRLRKAESNGSSIDMAQWFSSRRMVRNSNPQGCPREQGRPARNSRFRLCRSADSGSPRRGDGRRNRGLPHPSPPHNAIWALIDS